MDWTIHATVPFPMLEAADTARFIAELGVGPEIYFSGNVLDSLAPRRAETAGEALVRAGVRSVTFHAPFEDIWPGARDEEARRLAVRRLRQAVALAPAFRPRGIVIHGGYSGWIFDHDPDKWFEPARRTFEEVLETAEAHGVDLFVENVFDEVPDHLLRLSEAIGSKRLGFCLDAGHATLFSRVPVHKWVEAFGPGIREMHIHDNRGLRDDHLPVGEGSINFRGVLLAALDAGASPILTLEPHRIEHFHRGLSALRSLLADLGGC
ncbi:MAG: sugar phosphate isomerase/epimerase [Deltaproteobacteria bacterium]|nr:sugar phosphate isomerase/epimerase [Deltaproteobacteria bacterium]